MIHVLLLLLLGWDYYDPALSVAANEAIYQCQIGNINASSVQLTYYDGAGTYSWTLTWWVQGADNPPCAPGPCSQGFFTPCDPGTCAAGYYPGMMVDPGVSCVFTVWHQP